MWSWSDRWNNLYRRLLPAYWVFLFVVTHLPKLKLGGPRQTDKMVHVVAFGVLAFLFWRFAETFRRPLSGRFIFRAAAILLAYAALDEYLQQFVGRNTAWLDGLANAVGVAIVLTVLEAGRRRQIRTRSASGHEG
jgi:VanZ family protein